MGSILAENQVARRLNVSRTPVGRALRLLLREGLLEVGPRRQLVVRGFGPQHRDEVLRIRESLEVLAVESACAAADEEDFDRLRLLLFRQRRAAEADHADEFIALDEQFHLEMAESADLPILSAFLHQLRGFVRLMRLGKVTDSEHMLNVLHEHESILDALEARRPARARSALLAHLRRTQGVPATARTGAPRARERGGEIA
ncbi:MAG: GntR family transcriptional regulator [Actinomycetota bacterium]|nr:GntR family transcriptional regulator [Actinomycetota bacterium]